MARSKSPIPEGREGATPYLCCKGAAEAIEFYKKAFGAIEEMRMMQPDGRVGHAEVRIGRAAVMLADEYPEMGFRSPKTLGGSPVAMQLYVEDVDAFVGRAVEAGATLTRPVKDQFYGDRSGTLEDPFGHVWHVSSRIEDLTPEDLRKRAAAS